MATYIVQAGQNLLDVTLTLYGSIEGLLDLMTNNPSLSVNTEVKDGDKLEYTPYYYEDTTVLDFYKTNNVVPSNQVGTIYYKKMDNPRFWITLPSDIRTYSFKVSGKGVLYVDWGDNSEIEEIPLTSVLREFSHSADSIINEDRKVRIYGDFSLYSFDISPMSPNKMMVFVPVDIERFTIHGASYLHSIDFISLLNPSRVIDIDLSCSRIDDLTPILRLVNAKIINLGYCNMSSRMIDEFLIGLVENYGIRTNCTLNLIGSELPSGEYRKPDNLLHPKSGMEAVWVLVNEHKESSGPWKIILNNKTYT